MSKNKPRIKTYYAKGEAGFEDFEVNEDSTMDVAEQQCKDDELSALLEVAEEVEREGNTEEDIETYYTEIAASDPITEEDWGEDSIDDEAYYDEETVRDFDADDETVDDFDNDDPFKGFGEPTVPYISESDFTESEFKVNEEELFDMTSSFGNSIGMDLAFTDEKDIGSILDDLIALSESHDITVNTFSFDIGKLHVEVKQNIGKCGVPNWICSLGAVINRLLVLQKKGIIQLNNFNMTFDTMTIVITQSE